MKFTFAAAAAAASPPSPPEGLGRNYHVKFLRVKLPHAYVYIFSLA